MLKARSSIHFPAPRTDYWEQGEPSPKDATLLLRASSRQGGHLGRGPVSRGLFFVLGFRGGDRLSFPGGRPVPSQQISGFKTVGEEWLSDLIGADVGGAVPKHRVKVVVDETRTEG